MWLGGRVAARRANVPPPSTRFYLPFAIALGAYFAIAYVINRSNYLVVEGHYRAGWHAIGNALNYLTTLYVGPHGPIALALTGVAVLAVLLLGSPPAKFATAWMLIALLPYVFFQPGTTGRYMYLAAAGFSMLAVELMWAIAEAAQTRAPWARSAVVGPVLAAIVIVRFGAFTRHTTPAACVEGEPYLAWMLEFKRVHPSLPRGASVDVADPKRPDIDPRSFQPMLQLEYDDPDLRIRVVPAAAG
jgi:hypothetical protein